MVFREWGISSSADFGEMVFNLIDREVWQKTDRDSRDDFNDGFDLDTAFLSEFDVKLGE